MRHSRRLSLLTLLLPLRRAARRSVSHALKDTKPLIHRTINRTREHSENSDSVLNGPGMVATFDSRNKYRIVVRVVAWFGSISKPERFGLYRDRSCSDLRRIIFRCSPHSAGDDKLEVQSILITLYLPNFSEVRAIVIATKALHQRASSCSLRRE